MNIDTVTPWIPVLVGLCALLAVLFVVLRRERGVVELRELMLEHVVVSTRVAHSLDRLIRHATPTPTGERRSGRRGFANAAQARLADGETVAEVSRALGLNVDESRLLARAAERRAHD